MRLNVRKDRIENARRRGDTSAKAMDQPRGPGLQSRGWSAGS